MDGSTRARATATHISPGSARRGASCFSTLCSNGCSRKRSRRCSRTSSDISSCDMSLKRIAVVRRGQPRVRWRCSAGWSTSRGSTPASAFPVAAAALRCRAGAVHAGAAGIHFRRARRSHRLYSRRHEFEADAYAAENASAIALVAALVKLYEDNANTLTPGPASLRVL